MRRIFPDYVYSDAPRRGCYWDDTTTAPDWPTLSETVAADVAIIGGGFTGLSAALHLAEAGVNVALVDAKSPGWGASGRNGGFCCVGGSKRSEKGLMRDYGVEVADEYLSAETAAVDLVEMLIQQLGLEVDRHSQGETLLAHRPSDMRFLEAEAAETVRTGGPAPILLRRQDLAEAGLRADFYGALTTPKGFALNPQKYLFGLAKAAAAVGAQLFAHSPVTAITRADGGWGLTTPEGRITCDKVLICTNGYSSEDIPDWMAGRYMPAQSSVLVTRPLTDTEIAAQGWSSHQMCYDTRHLLHYFRLMPDRRMLFGMRGGLSGTEAGNAKAFVKLRQSFDRIFPAWRGVEATHSWSGMVCMTRHRLPYAGPVPDQPGMFAGFAYHGNGVAMGSLTGSYLAALAQGRNHVPRAMQTEPPRFEFRGARRVLMPPIYAALKLADI